MRRPQSDVDAVLSSVLVSAGAFASFSLLQLTLTAFEGSSIDALVPAETVGRLWVFFVLAPALLLLVGVGFPCLARAVIATVRGTIGRDGVVSLVAVALAASLVFLEASMQRSGAAALVLLCAVCLWRLRPRVRSLDRRLPGALLACTAAALLGFAAYAQRLLSGGLTSVAVAPTLFLLTFYATLVGVVVTAVSGTGAALSRIALPLLWLAIYATWIGAAHRWGVAGTVLAAVALGLLGAHAGATSRHGIDESRPFL